MVSRSLIQKKDKQQIYLAFGKAHAHERERVGRGHIHHQRMLLRKRVGLDAATAVVTVATVSDQIGVRGQKRFLGIHARQRVFRTRLVRGRDHVSGGPVRVGGGRGRDRGRGVVGTVTATTTTGTGAIRVIRHGARGRQQRVRACGAQVRGHGGGRRRQTSSSRGH
ncbi:hypothetical protein BC828DRAFT_275765 [Blastocladiella britannica]|nr:hypothetical protein BC828DRAFT_275765 [Blastocladiella britannica]